MIITTIKSKLFIRIWLWSLLLGIFFGVGLSVVIGLLLGLFQTPSGGDDMAQGFIFPFLLFGIANLVNHITALVIGMKYVANGQKDTRIFLAKALPLSITAFLISWILPPLLLFGSAISALVVVISISKIQAAPNVVK